MPVLPHDPNACTEFNNLSRRSFLRWSSAAAAAAAAAPAWLLRVSFAKNFISGRDVIVSVYLRGGADGLTLCVPYGDPAYAPFRPTLAIAPPSATDPNSAIDLNGYFGLAPAMAALRQPYLDGKLCIVHAAGLTDGTRSHFDAQRFMELGVARDPNLFTGWLGRHVASASPADDSALVRAIGVGYQLPTALMGGDLSVPVPDISSYTLTGSSGTRAARLNYLRSVYDRTEQTLRAAAANTQATIALLGPAPTGVGAGTYVPVAGVTYTTSSFQKALKHTAALIKADVGVEAVAIDNRSNWDTHSAQGNLTGDMAANMRDLATGLRAFYDDVIATGQNVTVVVMSEFGRRPQENASLGCDHGHGNAMFAMGNRIAGGQVKTFWPTLSNLYQNLDLQVTIDYRDVLAEIVHNRLGNTNLAAVFPGFTPTFRGVTN